MIVLGFNGGPKRAEEDDIFYAYSHDAAAALVKDKDVLAAVEEERLDRIKHSNCFPARAIDYCLKDAGLSWPDIDAVVYVSEPTLLVSYAQVNALEAKSRPIPLDAHAYITSLFEEQFGVNIREKLRFCDHHDAHSWSAFAFSGLDQALVLSIDGEGDGRAGVVSVADGCELTKLHDYGVQQSMGNLYTAIIRLLAYGCFDEYKAMGLAPYGDRDRFKDVFAKGYKLLGDGNYNLDPISTWLGHFRDANILQKARRSDQEFSKVHMDLAAGLQGMLEEVVLHILQYWQRRTGQRNLCLAGGVAHNCTLNGKILGSGLFDKVFVQPAAHDAGGALGAAGCIAFREIGAEALGKMQHVYLGPDVGREDTVEASLRRWGSLIEFERSDNIVKRSAMLLAEQAVIGWVQGRSEFGPRALGNRSILADPRPADNKDRINKMVKKREGFRPFAPSVIEERVRDFFCVPECQADLSFMTYSLPVRESLRTSLRAITHVDGTARVQTVSRNFNPRYWELLEEFGKITGVPILLNTSFNNDVEPIVNSVDDAIVCFLTTAINYLIIGDYLITRVKEQSGYDRYLNLIPSIPLTRKLVRCRNGSESILRMESTKGTPYGRKTASISYPTYRLLSCCNGNVSVGDLLNCAAIVESEDRSKVIQELIELWSRRMICLFPAD